MQINSATIYSIWPPLFLITCFSLPLKALHEAHRTSWGIKAYSSCNLVFRFSRESWEVRQALLSRMDHIEKSKVDRSGLLEGQSSLLMNAGMWAWIHRWVFLEPSKGAESCWKVQGVLHRSALGPMATVHLPKCPRCTTGCSISLLRARKRRETFQWLWRPPKP